MPALGCNDGIQASHANNAFELISMGLIFKPPKKNNAIVKDVKLDDTIRYLGVGIEDTLIISKKLIPSKVR
ncbi:hypothetical protein A6E01_17355 [Vibrio breoganii]|uniref:Uncharacterized protein n=1 Tax=Vibrio breoganii TaxID=553239 RepID=A0AAN0XY66_9VIBR|nr:hypothetical protein A6E01_17355 [Vibrio breoganii]PML12922.1 hypothetical protein BCT84_14885 [Vibrio breoganii]